MVIQGVTYLSDFEAKKAIMEMARRLEAKGWLVAGDGSMSVRVGPQAVWVTVAGADKAALTPTQFHEVSALSSVINMDYQICNGGIGQYVGNGYHEYRAPYSDDDVEHYGAVEQVYMLRALADFGDNVFPYADSCNREVRQWANLFDHIDFDSVDYYDEVIGEYVSPEAVEECEQSYYGGVSDHVGLLCEAYAQYLCKSYGID